MAKTKRKGPAPNANEKQLRAAAHRGMDRTMVFCGMRDACDKYRSVGKDGDA